MHMPWMVAASNIVWEPSACFIVDDAGRYDSLNGTEFSELVLYRALEAGTISESVGNAFMAKLYPGSREELFADRIQRFANLIVIRPSSAFRRPPDAPPAQSGPPSSADVNA